MGSTYKFRPTPERNFLRTVGPLLRSHPGARLFVIGPTKRTALEFFGDHVPPNCTFLGKIRDPREWEAAADLFLEPFPWGSMTAALESAAAGALPVLLYDPTPQLDISPDPAFAGLVVPARSEEDYVQSLNRLMRESRFRREQAVQVRDAVLGHHTGSTWQSSLQEALDVVNATGARRRPVPRAPSRHSRADLDLVALQSADAESGSKMFRIAGDLHRQLGPRGIARLLWISLESRDSSIHPLTILRWARLAVVSLWRAVLDS
jgi:hypothetical protein